MIKYPVRSLMNIAAAFLSIAGAVILIVEASHATAWHIVSFSIYALSLIALWSVSAVYHTLNAQNLVLEQLDHAMIYFLIAGTYTPVCLIVLKGGWGWSLFGINWTLAIAAIVLHLVFRNLKRWAVVLFFILYLVMGWLIVVAWFPLVRALPSGGMFWLVLGGCFYTFGTIAFGLKHLKFSAYFGAHEIWHLFVMAGSFSHYWLMFKYVMTVR